ncbi:Tat pathway signal protein [Streptomyces sp. R28]|uniref:Tat pathway signal protein n=1 Tax=Streptomyces sp. R28 TaxID=3238628 RepID=A0AB39Q6U4_9ACTN
MRKTRTSRVRAGLLAAALTGALAISVTPASANVSDGYVSGAYEFQDDFGDEGTLSVSSHTHSNATALWQWILWAEGAKKSNGNAFRYADIDCWFGSDTKSATVSLQRTLRLDDIDGIVGNETFGAVDGNIEYVSTDYDSSTYRTKLRYAGDANAFFLYRSASGVYQLHIPNADRKPASYTSASC